MSSVIVFNSEILHQAIQHFEPMASKVGWDSLAKIHFGRIYSGGFRYAHFFATDGGPQLTLLTQLEKLLISLAILTGGPN